ncbi:MAG: alpha/beta fold hydrolase [Acidimicrobiales bacterium]
MRLRQVPSNLGALQLAVAEFGENGPPVLLVHGFTGAKEEFTGLAEGLAEGLAGLRGPNAVTGLCGPNAVTGLRRPNALTGRHAAAVDLRGHGGSDQPAESEAYDLGAFVADVAGVADALGWSRFSLVGHSMGGAVAQRFALDHRERVDRLVLMSTFHGPVDVDTQLVALGMAIVRQGGMEALAAAQAVRREGDPAAVAARERMERAHPGYGAWSDAKLLRCSPAMWLAMAPRFATWPDTLPEMAGLDVPTLVLVGADDDTMRPQCEALAAAVPGAQLAVIDGVRHSPHLEAPAACLAAVTAFLDSE